MDISFRSAAREDIEAIVALVSAKDVADLGEAEADDPFSIRAELEADWRRLGADVERNAWVALDGSRIVGYTDVSPVPPRALVNPNGGVLPSHRRRGIGTRLLDLAEARAAELEPRPRGVRTVVPGGTAATQALLRSRGYEEVSRSWQMTVDLDEPPPAAQWPARVSVRRFRPGEDDEIVYRLVRDAFSDNEGYDAEGSTFEGWTSYMLDRERDVSLYFLAEDESGMLVGCALCPWYPDIGWIQQVAVRRDRRGQGLGMALLRHAFGELYRRGQRRVGLTVDSWNTTGAKRLYQRAGMRVTLEHVKLEKQLG